MPFLAPVLVLFAIAWRTSSPGPAMVEWIGTGWTWAFSLGLLLWPVIAGWPAHLILGREMDRRGSAGAATASHRIQLVQGLLVAAGGGIAIVFVGLLDAIREVVGDLVAVDEILTGMVCGAAWAFVLVQTHPIERRLWEASKVALLDRGGTGGQMPGLVGWVWIRLRESVLVVAAPAALMLVWWEVVPGVVETLDRWAPGLGLVMDRGVGAETAVVSERGMAVAYSGVALIAAIGPRLMSVVLPTVRLRDGSVLDEVRSVCRVGRVRTPAMYLWRPSRGWANAAVMGAVPWGRSMLVSETLVSGMERAHLSAVVAHEVGHLRYRHVLWLAASVVACLLGMEALLLLWGGMVGPATGGMMTLVVVASAFGAVSRRFELQADAFAAGVLGNGETVARALERVAWLNGSRRERWSYTHGSIAARITRLRMMDAQPNKTRIRVGWIAFRMVVVAVIGASSGVLLWAEPASG
jgi:Zn-dependent protease with chaperone function